MGPISPSAPSWILFFLLISILSTKFTNAEFVEQCQGGPGRGLCEFSNGIVQSTQYMIRCGQDGPCSCQLNRYIMDARMWSVEWKNGKCYIADGGPCGISNEDSTLELGCSSPSSKCIQGRCRNPATKRAVNERCDEDVDCQDGLKCITIEFRFPEGAIRRCRA